MEIIINKEKNYASFKDSNGVTHFRKLGTLEFKNCNGKLSFESKCNECSLSEVLSKITVNGTQATKDNYDSLLADLFFSGTSISDGGTTYAKIGDDFPANPEIGDIVIFTDDGTEGGNLDSVYEWNGVFWQIKSKEGNIILKAKSLSNIDYMIIPMSSTKVVVDRVVSDTYTKDSEGLPIRLFVNEVAEILKLQEGEDYYIDSIYISPSAAVKLNGNFNSGETDLGFYTYSHATDVPVDIDIRNLYLASVDYGVVINNLYVENVFRSNNSGEMVVNYLYGNIYLKNIIYDSIRIGAYYRDNENIMEVIFDNVKTVNGYHFDLSRNLNTGTYKTPATFRILNVALGLELSFTNAIIKSLFFSGTSVGTLTDINLSECEFETQENCDNFYMALYNMGFGNNVSSVVNSSGNDFIPSQNIQDLLTSRGVILNF